MRSLILNIRYAANSQFPIANLRLINLHPSFISPNSEYCLFQILVPAWSVPNLKCASWMNSVTPFVDVEIHALWNLTLFAVLTVKPIPMNVLCDKRLAEREKLLTLFIEANVAQVGRERGRKWEWIRQISSTAFVKL